MVFQFWNTLAIMMIGSASPATSASLRRAKYNFQCDPTSCGTLPDGSPAGTCITPATNGDPVYSCHCVEGWIEFGVTDSIGRNCIQDMCALDFCRAAKGTCTQNMNDFVCTVSHGKCAVAIFWPGGLQVRLRVQGQSRQHHVRRIWNAASCDDKVECVGGGTCVLGKDGGFTCDCSPGSVFVDYGYEKLPGCHIDYCAKYSCPGADAKCNLTPDGYGAYYCKRSDGPTTYYDVNGHIKHK